MVTQILQSGEHNFTKRSQRLRLAGGSSLARVTNARQQGEAL